MVGVTAFQTAQADSEVQAVESIESSISGQNNWASTARDLQKKLQTSLCQRMGVMLTAESKRKRYEEHGRSWLRPCKLGEPSLGKQAHRLTGPRSCNTAYPSATEIKNHETYTKMEGLQ